jgi:hypothetical protein
MSRGQTFPRVYFPGLQPRRVERGAWRQCPHLRTRAWGGRSGAGAIKRFKIETRTWETAQRPSCRALDNAGDDGAGFWMGSTASGTEQFVARQP